MKIQLTTSDPIRRRDGNRDVEVGFGSMGEAISFETTGGHGTSFLCLFYGRDGLFWVDEWDLRPVS